MIDLKDKCQTGKKEGEAGVRAMSHRDSQNNKV